MASKKHRDNELKAAIRLSKQVDPDPELEPTPVPDSDATMSSVEPSTSAAPVSDTTAVTMNVDADADEDEINQTIDQKIASARSRLSSSHWLRYSENCIRRSTFPPIFCP